MPKIIRITTVPLSLKLLLRGQMKYMASAGWEVLMVSGEGKEWEEVIKNENCRHHIVPFTRKITPIRDLVCLWKLIKLFQAERPDIVHTHTPKAGLLGMLAARICGIGIRVHTLAGLPFLGVGGKHKKLLIFLEKLTYRLSKEVWPNSYSLKDFLVTNELAPEEKIRVIAQGSSNGVDLEKFSRENLKENHLVAAMMRVAPAEHEFVITFAGRLVRDKGIEELIEAYIASKIVEKSKLVLLGSYEQDLDPISLQTKKRIEDHPRIIHVEWTDHIAYYLAISDILVHPSHREGFPNVLLEAAAMSCPIVCSDIPGNLEVVKHKKTGLVYPVKNRDALKEAMEFAYIKREEMNGYADRLHVEVREKYDRKRVHQAILESYFRLWDTKKSLSN
ncbi:glycosyltransferase family 4 protein [Pleomorphovibrio marinus]|uniref:glycosyltransferase family 4 protein n=1 Tax=Pleomorphovibrio marinus TaxID=2164132 RepID=UPI000E0B5E60|nr:glycosyltransferase family 4 protein [Pleomorphovibrio marinus]